jgi:hypothetical protein
MKRSRSRSVRLSSMKRKHQLTQELQEGWRTDSKMRGNTTTYNKFDPIYYPFTTKSGAGGVYM